MDGIERGGVLAEGVEIGENAGGPIGGAVVDGGGAFPFAGGEGFLVEVLELLIEFRVETFDTELVLLPDVAGTCFPIFIDGPLAGDLIDGAGEGSNDLVVTDV